jgi:hypothetical protein
MTFAFQALADDSLDSSRALRLVATIAVVLLAGIFVVTTGHINMGWAGNEFIGP